MQFPKKPYRKKGKQSTKQKQFKALDSIFSQYIRLKSSFEGGYVKCFTCNAIKIWAGTKMLHAGHYIGRENKMVRWDERNVKPQCYKCNCWGEGNKAVYIEKLKSEYGDDILEILLAKSRGKFIYNEIEMKERIKHFRAEVKALKIKKGVE